MTNTHPLYIVIVYQALTFEGTSYKNFKDTTAKSFNFLLLVGFSFYLLAS